MVNIALCYIHAHSWDTDREAPRCDCNYDLMVIEEPELPFYGTIDEAIQKK